MWLLNAGPQWNGAPVRFLMVSQINPPLYLWANKKRHKTLSRTQIHCFIKPVSAAMSSALNYRCGTAENTCCLQTTRWENCYFQQSALVRNVARHAPLFIWKCCTWAPWVGLYKLHGVRLTRWQDAGQSQNQETHKPAASAVLNPRCSD